MSLSAREISDLLEAADPNEVEIKALLIGTLLGAERNSPGIVANTILSLNFIRAVNGGQKLTSDEAWPTL